MTMHDGTNKLETSYLEQLSLLKELRDCLEEEGHRLTRREVDFLWGLFERKMEILRALEAAQAELHDLSRESTGIPEGQKSGQWTGRGRLQAISMATARLQEEVRKRARENMGFVEDCLCFLDQLAAALAGAGQPSLSYARLAKKAGKGAPLLVRREV